MESQNSSKFTISRVVHEVKNRFSEKKNHYIERFTISSTSYIESLLYHENTPQLSSVELERAV